MGRPKKNKPSAPRKIAAAQAANDDEARLTNVRLRESRAEAARLKAQGGEVNIDKATGLITGAWRKDVFTILRDKRGKPSAEYPNGKPALALRSYEAFREHESDLHLSEGASNGDRRPDFIRGSVDGAPGQAVTTEALDAGRRVRETNRRLSPPDASLLAALMDGDAALASNWRETVKRQTGEAQDEGQTARIRSLGDNLHWARTTVKAEYKKPSNDATPHVGDAPKNERQPTWFRGSEFG